MMRPPDPISVIFLLLFLIVVCFYLFRLAHPPTWIHRFDAENEVGHGMMAIDMIFMLMPAGWLPPDIIRWNILLFAASSLWWTVRLCARKPLLAIILRTPGGRSTMRAEAIHVFMHGGMTFLTPRFSSKVSSTGQP